MPQEKTIRFCYLDGKCLNIPVRKLDMQAAANVNINDLDSKDHPNAIPWSGTLLLIDQASDKPPQGADGHLIKVDRATAERQLSTLPGMAINYSPAFNKHEPTKKIGVISSGWIDGNRVKVKGIIWGKDFPKAAEEIKANMSRLGMSMELADVYVENKDSKVWNLQDFKFTGGTILLKNSAAYYKTSMAAKKAMYVQALAAAAALEGKSNEGERNKMAHTKKPDPQTKGKFSVKHLAAAVAVATAASLKDLIEQMSANLSEQTKATRLLAAAVLKKGVEAKKGKAKPSLASSASPASSAISAASPNASMSAAEEDELTAALENQSSVAAAQGASSASSDGTSSSGTSSSATSVEAGVTPSEVGSSDPDEQDASMGKVNKNANAKFKKHSTAHLRAAAEKIEKKYVKELSAMEEQIATLNQKRKKDKGLIASMQAQIENFSSKLNRQTVGPELRMILAKNNVDAAELVSNGQKIPVEKFDEMFAAAGINLDPTTRIALKNQATQLGILETGEVQR